MEVVNVTRTSATVWAIVFFCLTSTNSYLIACYIHSGVEEYVVNSVKAACSEAISGA